jgi:hypothetical protein
LIGSSERHPTLLFNGYGAFTAGMEKERLRT